MPTTTKKHNADLAVIFSQMASALELLGANPFRVNAHQRVARTLGDLHQDVGDIIAEDPETAEKRLAGIEGVGTKSAKKIIEFVETGKVEEHGELLAQVPSGLFEVLEIPGLGPKTVKLMWEDLGITTVAELKSKLDSDELTNLPRMGKKTIDNIRKAIAFSEKGGDRIQLGLVHPFAVELVERLRRVKGVKRAEFAGSLRRGKETIGDVDLLVSTTKPDEAREFFTTMDEVTQVLAKGETKCSVRLETGRLSLQADLRIIPEASWGAALMYFTGSKEHNVRLREIAIRKDMRLNEYGLYKGTDERPQESKKKPVAAKDEESIYKALDLAWIPPEVREDRGELDGFPDDLIEFDDVKCDLHCHTTASDGKMSIDELVEAAKARGFHTIAVTDHSVSSVVANGLDPDRLLKHVDAVREADAKHKGIKVLAGSEVDIHADGRLDYTDKILERLDVVVASPHVSLRQKPDEATKRLITAIKHPLVHIIGHPTGRMISTREGLEPDINALIDAAIESNTALEINANYRRLDLRDTHVRAAAEAGCLIAIDTDAHRETHFDFLPYGVMTARRGWLPRDLCVNTWSARKLHAWLKKKRK